MSPSWRSQLYIAISPERISLLRLGRGLRPKVLAKHDEAVGISGKQPAWQAALERLDAILSQPEWQDATVNVVLSNRLVNCAAIPFDAQLKDKSAQEAFARYSLAQTFGPAAAQWDLRIRRGKAGTPWLVCAVDKALLQQIRQICTTHKLKLGSITPYLVSVFNRHHKAIKPESAWLVVNEPGYSLFALLRDKEFVTLNGVCHDSIRELPLLLDRENLASPLAESCKSVYLSTPSGNGISAMPKMGYEVSVLSTAMPDGFPPASEGLYAMAASIALRGQPGGMDFQQAVKVSRRWAGWMLLVAGLALLAEMGFSYDKLQRERETINREVRTSKLRMDSPREAPAVRKFSDEDFEKGRQIINRLSTPWESFFAGVESVSSENAAILSIDPDVQTGMLRIEGEAKDYASLLTLVAQLRTTKPFSKVFLVRHETKRDDPQHPVSFTLSLRWVQP